MNVRKPFSKALYKESDDKAKKQMYGWLMANDHAQIDMSENYNFDLVSTVDKGLPRHLYEVEIKRQWKYGEWPDNWKDIRIPYRKKRLLDIWKKECPEDLLTFVVFRLDLQRAWHIDGDTLLDSEVREFKNRLVPNGEMFFHVRPADAYEMDMTYESNSGY